MVKKKKKKHAIVTFKEKIENRMGREVTTYEKVNVTYYKSGEEALAAFLGWEEPEPCELVSGENKKDLEVNILQAVSNYLSPEWVKTFVDKKN